MTPFAYGGETIKLKGEITSNYYYYIDLHNEIVNVRHQVGTSQTMDIKQLEEFGEILKFMYSINFSLPPS